MNFKEGLGLFIENFDDVFKVDSRNHFSRHKRVYGLGAAIAGLSLTASAFLFVDGGSQLDTLPSHPTAEQVTEANSHINEVNLGEDIFRGDAAAAAVVTLIAMDKLFDRPRRKI